MKSPDDYIELFKLNLNARYEEAMTDFLQCFDKKMNEVPLKKLFDFKKGKCPVDVKVFPANLEILYEFENDFLDHLSQYGYKATFYDDVILVEKSND